MSRRSASGASAFGPAIYEEKDMDTSRIFETMRKNPSANIKAWERKFSEEAEARGRAEGEARGRAEGEARGSIFTALEIRGLSCSGDQRRRIEEETDLQLLQRWAARSRIAASVAELLAELH